MESIENQLFAIVEREFGFEPGHVTPQIRLRDHGDSLDWFSLMTALEDAFSIEIGDEHSRSLATVGDLLQAIRIRVPA